MSSFYDGTTLPILLTRDPGDTDLALFGPRLTIVPDSSGWNDFGANYRATMQFAGFPTAHKLLNMHVMFDTVDYLSEVIPNDTNSVRLDDLTVSFTTLLGTADSYRRLVAIVGYEATLHVLRRLNDAVLAEVEDGSAQYLNDRQFFQSVLRSDEAWNSLQNGRRYLTPHSMLDVEDAATAFRMVTNLVRPGDAIAIDAEFGDEFPLSRRSLVLVGENGVGKTRLLRAMVEALKQGPSLSANGGSFYEIRPNVSRVVLMSSAASDAHIQKLNPSDGLDYRYHRMAGQSFDAIDDLAISLLNCQRGGSDDGEFAPADRSELLGATLERMGLADQIWVQITDKLPDDMDISTFQLDGKLFTNFFRAKGEQRRLQLQARMVKGAPLMVVRDGEVRHLSSGEQALLRFSAHAIGSARQGTLFMFDEPETHLHPTFISLFVAVLDEILEATKSIAIIATHSAFIVREVPSRRVRILRNPASSVVVETPVMQTFGASIDTICQYVFGDLYPVHRFQAAIRDWIHSQPTITLDEFRQRFSAEMNLEIAAYARQAFDDRGDS